MQGNFESSGIQEEVRRRTAQLEALRQVEMELAAQLDLDRLLRSIVTEAIKLLGAMAGGFFIYRPEQNILVLNTLVGIDFPPGKTFLHRGEGVAGRVWAAGKPLIVDNYQHWDGRAFIDEGSPFDAVIGVPIYCGLTEPEFLGVLDVMAVPPCTFTWTDAELLALFANQATIAIRNARLYQELQQRVLEQQTLRGAMLALTTTLDRDEVIDRILAQLQAVVPYDTASVQLLRDGRLEIVGGRGFQNLEALLEISFDPGRTDNPNREVVLTRVPFIVEDVAAVYEEFKRAPHAAAQIHSWLGVPMLMGERLLGMIALDKKEVGFYTQKHAQLAEAFAAQAAVAIENSRLFFAEKEQRELAVHLHQEVLDHAEQLEARVQERTTELQIQYARLDAILRSTADGIVVVDAGGDIVQANPVAQAWLTRTLSLEDADQLRQAIRCVVKDAGTDIAPGTLPMQLLELTGLDLEVRGSPILNPEDGAFASTKIAGSSPTSTTSLERHPGAPWVVVAIHDVSHLKALDRMKTQFITDISHELRTPVATIKLYAHLMQKRPEKWQDYLLSLVKQADHQAQLIANILEMTRLDSGRIEVQPLPSSLNGLVETVVEGQFMERAEGRGLLLSHQLSEPGLVALIDHYHITQALNHLVRNAIDYTSKGGTVLVSTARRVMEGRAWGTITVSDTGMGIPEVELPHIFDRFFRGEKPRAMQIPGTGLGLVIAKTSVEFHGGRITVESEIDEGSTFTMWLPLSE